ncbi:MAG: hypothetical protein M1484_02175 [Patescibacteria group bacterium]|nr:hypothetical protein [Patescibacteria group bacterium]
MENVKLVLIDGHAILHRAYHALPPLTSRTGLQTNAVYGFVTMLLRVLADLKPDYLAVAFDLPAPTFRQQLYTQYQGKRPEMEGNLTSQIPLVHKLLEALKISFFEVAGFEADDIIGTLAQQANCEVVIVTGDRDMLQLVNSHVKVCVPVKGLSETKIYDEVAVRAEFGVLPHQWVDVKALKGDASDNYPGVAGIGPKTAEKLIAQLGTLENLYKNLDKVEPKIAKKLAEGAELAGLSQKLARIVTNVPVHLDLTSAQVQDINWQNGVKYMKETLGFKTIVERVEKEHIKNNAQLKFI